MFEDSDLQRSLIGLAAICATGCDIGLTDHCITIAKNGKEVFTAKGHLDQTRLKKKAPTPPATSLRDSSQPVLSAVSTPPVRSLRDADTALVQTLSMRPDGIVHGDMVGGKFPVLSRRRYQ